MGDGRGVCVEVAASTGIAVGGGVSVGAGVSVGVGVAVSVLVGGGVTVAVGEGGGVFVGSWVGELSAVGTWVGVSVGSGDGTMGSMVGTTVGCGVQVGVALDAVLRAPSCMVRTPVPRMVQARTAKMLTPTAICRSTSEGGWCCDLLVTLLCSKGRWFAYREGLVDIEPSVQLKGQSEVKGGAYIVALVPHLAAMGLNQ